MSTTSNIEWTDASWNPTTGCTPVSAGCANCYAVPMTHRCEAAGNPKYQGLTVLQPNGRRQFNGEVRCNESALTIPLRWRTPRRIFVNSMSDLFHERVPFEFIAKVYAVALHAQRHAMQILTKRPERAAEFYEWLRAKADRPYDWLVDLGRQELPNFERARSIDRDRPHGRSSQWPLCNVWLGTSCEHQAAADERIPHLLRCPAAVRFLSCEPLLGAIDVSAHLACRCDWKECVSGRSCGIGWVIAGGESGPRSRPCNIDWLRSLRAQCRAAGVPFFLKQLGSYVLWSGIQGGYLDGPSNVWPNHDRLFEESGGFRKYLRSKKGGDMAEWPEDLRVRGMPAE